MLSSHCYKTLHTPTFAHSRSDLFLQDAHDRKHLSEIFLIHSEHVTTIFIFILLFFYIYVLYGLAGIYLIVLYSYFTLDSALPIDGVSAASPR